MEKTLYVFDLDGVLFDNHQRQDLLPTGDGQTTEQWDAFNLACENDEPIAHMFALLIELFKSGNSIVFLTGRSDVCRTQTINALQAVLQGHMSRSAIQLALNMRRQSDHRSGAEFKRSFLLRLKYDGRVVLIDDDPTIVEACRDVVSAVIHVKPHQGCAAVQKHRTVSMPAAMAAPYGAASGPYPFEMLLKEWRDQMVEIDLDAPMDRAIKGRLNDLMWRSSTALDVASNAGQPDAEAWEMRAVKEAVLGELDGVDARFVWCCLNHYLGLLESGEVKWGCDNLEYLKAVLDIFDRASSLKRVDRKPKDASHEESQNV